MPQADATILLIDENPSDTDLLRNALSKKHLNISARAIINGSEAMALLHASTAMNTPDAILLDYHMPIMHGLEFLKKIATHPNFSQIPLIIWTGSPNPGVVKECQDAGANLVRSKPYGASDYISFANELADFTMQSKSSRQAKS